MVEIISAKLISYVKVDFSTEAEMEMYINMFEKEGENFYNELKKVGLLRWRFNRVWNKTGGFSVSLIYEYADEKSYQDCQIEIGKFVKQNESFYKKLNIKRISIETGAGNFFAPARKLFIKCIYIDNAL